MVRQLHHVRRRARLAVTAVTLGVAVGVAAPLAGTASAAAAAPGNAGPVLLGSKPMSAVAGSGVSAPAANAPEAPTAPQRKAMLSLRPTDEGAAARSRVASNEGGGYACTESINTFTGGIGEDDFLEETVRVDYFAQLECNFYLASIEGVAGVLDRSESFNGESFDGRVLGTGTYVYREWDYYAESFGAIGVRASDYNGGRRIEAAFELYLLAPEGIVWDACNPVPGLRYLACEGLGTDYLHVVLGTGPFNTGMTKACRDLRGAVDAEQARLRLPQGTTPASTQILRRVTGVKNEVTAFKQALCTVTSAAAAGGFADGRGLQLWNVATAAARAGTASGDDRPLYWARLSMTTAFEQWRPTFGVDRHVLRARLDQAARGMTSHSFQPGSARKVFVSGFDPFALFDNIFNGNPSGASAIALDGTTVAGAEVQAVVFPVRYLEFNASLVENVFRPHLEAGAQQASFIVTMSQGGNRFDLELHNGRRRSSDFPDNLGQRGGGSYQNPVVPPGMGQGNEFVPSSLPVHKMLGVQSPYPTVINRQVHEQSPPGSPSRPNPSGPTPGSVAVEGSGGGFLSNEIAYRVTRLRDELRVAVPAGHVHTPTPSRPAGANDGGFDSTRSAIVGQARRILEVTNPIDSAKFFVRQQYRDFLNREPDAAGLEFWADPIIRCGTDAACVEREQVNVSMAFWYSGEFLDARPGLRNPPGTSPDFDNEEFVRQAYLVYLRRAADPPGFAFWLEQLNRDNDYWHLAKAFLVSIDYRARFGPA